MFALRELEKCIYIASVPGVSCPVVRTPHLHSEPTVRHRNRCKRAMICTIFKLRYFGVRPGSFRARIMRWSARESSIHMRSEHAVRFNALVLDEMVPPVFASVGVGVVVVNVEFYAGV